MGYRENVRRIPGAWKNESIVEDDGQRKRHPSAGGSNGNCDAEMDSSENKGVRISKLAKSYSDFRIEIQVCE
jgi:hypothetical protein